MSESAKNQLNLYAGAGLAIAIAALIGLQAAAASSALAADLYGNGAYDRRAYASDDPRYDEIYEVPRRDRYVETYEHPDVRGDKRHYDDRYDRQEPRERYQEPRDRYQDAARPFVPDRYVARDFPRRIYRNDPHADSYADRVPSPPALSLKDSPAAEAPYAGPTGYHADRYEAGRYEAYARDRYRRHDARVYGTDAYRGTAPPRYRDDFDRQRACLARSDIKRSLRSEGWRGFVDFDFGPGSHRARVNARRTFDGRRFILTLDGCTGDIIAALPIEPRYDRW